MVEMVTGAIGNFGDWLLEGFKSALLGLLEWIATGIIDSSYWICLIAAIIGVLLYAAGVKKAGKYASVSLVIYVLLEILGVVIKSAK